MGTHLVALRWNGSKLSREQLLGRAQSAVQVVQAQFDYLNQLNIQVIPDEVGQFVQLVIQSDCTVEESESMQELLKEEFTKTHQSQKPVPVHSLTNPLSRSSATDSVTSNSNTLGKRISSSLLLASFLIPLTLGLAYLGLRMTGFTFRTWGIFTSTPPDSGSAFSNLISIPTYYIFGFVVALVVTCINVTLILMPIVAIVAPITNFKKRIQNDSKNLDATDHNQEFSGNASSGQRFETPTSTYAICSGCGEPYGELASLGFQTGGYLCNKCGKRMCDRCCYRKGKSLDRVTMLCHYCGDDSMTAFRV